jgi:hypothetical protein
VYLVMNPSSLSIGLRLNILVIAAIEFGAKTIESERDDCQAERQIDGTHTIRSAVSGLPMSPGTWLYRERIDNYLLLMFFIHLRDGSFYPSCFNTCFFCASLLT